ATDNAVLRKLRNRVVVDSFSSRPQTFFQPSQAEVRGERQNCGGNSSGKDELIVHHCETAKDELAQTSGSDCSGDGGKSHRNDDSYAYSGKNYAQGQWQFHLKQELAGGESHTAPGFDHCGID